MEFSGIGIIVYVGELYDMTHIYMVVTLDQTTTDLIPAITMYVSYKVRILTFIFEIYKLIGFHLSWEAIPLMSYFYHLDLILFNLH